MSAQCNNCGSFEYVRLCPHCTQAAICTRCEGNHAPFCEELQKRKKRGQGPTVGNVPMPAHRAGHETPPTTEPDRLYSMPGVLGAPYLPENAITMEQAFEHLANAGLHPILRSAIAGGSAAEEQAKIDEGLEGVKDLLAE